MYLEVSIEIWCWALTGIDDVACLETLKLKVPGYLKINMLLTLVERSQYLVHKVNPVVVKALIIVCSTASINLSISFGSATDIFDGY